MCQFYFSKFSPLRSENRGKNIASAQIFKILCTNYALYGQLAKVLETFWCSRNRNELKHLTDKFKIFPLMPFLAGENSLLEHKTQPKHTDASYGTCDMWNYPLDWYQKVLGCLRVPMYVFTKNAIIEVNFSHCPKITILWVGPNCTHFRQLL